MKALFRADASLKIGTGHVMRCLTLAEVLRAHGVACKFACRSHPGNLINLLRQRGFEVIDLPYICNWGGLRNEALTHADWLGADWSSDVEQVKVGVGETAFDLLVVDHYALDSRWESAMRVSCRRIMVIDDLADRYHDCDLLLDQNLVADMAHRYDGRVPGTCGRLLGPEYALLQPLYAELHLRTPPRIGPIRRIFVYFGGADNENLTGRTIAAFISLGRADIVLDVVINPATRYLAAIREQTISQRNITLHEGFASLAPLMSKADLAIGAGGATSWERCCMGLPSLVITLAENQKPIAAELDRQAYIRWLGHHNTVSESVLKTAINNVLSDNWLPDCSKRCMSIVDGTGAMAVASIVMLDSTSTLTARLASVADEALILKWLNNYLICQTLTIDIASHRGWFYNCLRNPERYQIYIIENETGIPVGLVRFELNSDIWGVHYSPAAVARDLKLDKNCIKVAIDALRTSTDGVLVFGEVLIEGATSAKILDNYCATRKTESGRLIGICSDLSSWINEFIAQLLLDWLLAGHRVAWGHSASKLPCGDICFYLSYGRIVDRATRSRFRNNIVVHESKLPQGKGWSPLTWQILEGQSSVWVSLIEANDRVDSGPIYAEDLMVFQGNELIDEIRTVQFQVTRKLCSWFIDEYPESATQARDQFGTESFYSRRGPQDSELDPYKSLADQFNLLRIVDNDRYPAFFKMNGSVYRLAITKLVE